MNDTLARAWAGIARHPDLAEALAAIAGPLAQAHGIVGLRIDRRAAHAPRWDTVARTGTARALQRVVDADTARRLQQATTPLVRIDGETEGLVSAAGSIEADPIQAWAGPLPTDDDSAWRLTIHIRAVHGPGFEAVAADWRDLFAVAVANHRRLAELQALRQTAEADRRALLQRRPERHEHARVIGEQAGLATVFERVALVAPSELSVLLLGDTGSGKEVVARAVHERSLRAAAPFIRVNCGAIAPELINSELFGHEKGSFTGAAATRRGWFERADGGTLFLDEVAELPAMAQVRLLRVLQDKRIQRVGGEEEITVDVRVVAATHRDLERRVREARFREDLWYRLAVFPIRIPALAERRRDIAELVGYFIERAAARLGLTPVYSDPDQLRALEAYPWPGNVRELISVIERAVVLGQGRRLALEAALGPGLPPVAGGALAHDGPRPTRPVAEGHRPPDRLDTVVADHIRYMLEQTHGRIAGPHGAARRLALHPNTLRSRMARLGITAGDSRSRSIEHDPS